MVSTHISSEISWGSVLLQLILQLADMLEDRKTAKCCHFLSCVLIVQWYLPKQ